MRRIAALLVVAAAVAGCSMPEDKAALPMASQPAPTQGSSVPPTPERVIYHDMQNRTVTGKIMQYGEPGQASGAEHLCEVWFETFAPNMSFKGYDEHACAEAAAGFRAASVTMHYGNVTCPSGTCEGILHVEETPVEWGGSWNATWEGWSRTGES